MIYVYRNTETNDAWRQMELALYDAFVDGIHFTRCAREGVGYFDEPVLCTGQ